MKTKQTFTIAVLALALAAAPAFAQTGMEQIVSTLDSVAARFNGALPLQAMQGLSWSHAYIGQLIGVPPHFGVGIAANLSLIPADEFSSLMASFGVGSLPLAVIPNPGYTVEARVGGFILPFDVGLKLGVLPSQDNLLGTGLSMDYFLAGADLRYALLKDTVAIPALSVGFGLNYLKGSLGYSFGNQSFQYTTAAGTGTLSLEDPYIGFQWETWVFELKAQISKNFVIVTPYAGLGLNYATSRAGLVANTRATVSVGNLDDILNELGLVPTGNAGFERMNDLDGFGMRFFGGLSFDIAFIKIDLSATGATGTGFDFGRFTFGGSLGLRFQL